MDREARVDLRLREVQEADFRVVVDLLQAISAHAPPESQWECIWMVFASQPHVHGVVAVQVGGAVDQVVGYGSLCVDLKIRGGSIGHIEDIVVAPKFRRHGVGNLIVRALIDLARAKGCYKVSLECRDDKVPFYAQLGFAHTGCAMSMLLGKDSASGTVG